MDNLTCFYCTTRWPPKKDTTDCWLKKICYSTVSMEFCCGFLKQCHSHHLGMMTKHTTYENGESWGMVGWFFRHCCANIPVWRVSVVVNGRKSCGSQNWGICVDGSYVDPLIYHTDPDPSWDFFMFFLGKLMRFSSGLEWGLVRWPSEKDGRFHRENFTRTCLDNDGFMEIVMVLLWFIGDLTHKHVNVCVR